ncbi:MAG: hypothetical protein U9P70_03650 [Patescibacteria group bacterium]|nr:hypothetical protein [Patescibacteria group bacterium]
MEKHFCEECEKEITKENFFEISSREGTHGIRIPKLIGEFCSLKCIGSWINRDKREVKKTTEREDGKVKKETFWNHELKRKFNSCDIHEEKGNLCVKPEIWNALVKD